MTKLSKITCNVCGDTVASGLSPDEKWTTWQLIPYIKQQPGSLSQLASFASNNAVDVTLHTCGSVVHV